MVFSVKISIDTLGVHMLTLLCDKNEHMHTQSLHCEVKQSKVSQQLVVKFIELTLFFVAQISCQNFMY